MRLAREVTTESVPELVDSLGCGFRCGAGVANFRVDGWGEWRGVTHHRILHATSGDLIGAVRGSALVQWRGEEDSDLDASPGAARCGHTAEVVMVRFQVPRQGEQEHDVREWCGAAGSDEFRRGDHADDSSRAR